MAGEKDTYMWPNDLTGFSGPEGRPTPKDFTTVLAGTKRVSWFVTDWSNQVLSLPVWEPVDLTWFESRAPNDLTGFSGPEGSPTRQDFTRYLA